MAYEKRKGKQGRAEEITKRKEILRGTRHGIKRSKGVTRRQSCSMEYEEKET